MAEQQLLRAPDAEPTPEAIAEGLGPANGAYLKFLQALEGRGVQVAWRYYNDGKAWLGKGLYKWTTGRGTAKETTVFWLSIWEGFFKVSVFIPEKARAAALALPLGEEVRGMIADAGQMGKLKFFPLIFDVRGEEPLEVISALVDFKKAIK